MTSRLVKGVSAAVLLALSGLGCGGGDEDLSAYIGTWQFAGMETFNCPAPVGTGTSTVMSTVTIGKGVESPLAVIVGPCTIKIDPSGNAATLRAGQACPPVMGGTADNPFSETDTYQMGSISIIGRTANVNEAGTAVLNFSNTGAVVTCSFVTSGTMTKSTQ